MMMIGRKAAILEKSASYTYFIFSRICKLAAILNNLRRAPIGIRRRFSMLKIRCNDEDTKKRAVSLIPLYCPCYATNDLQNSDEVAHALLSRVASGSCAPPLPCRGRTMTVNHE